jgi:hypothetical protein
MNLDIVGGIISHFRSSRGSSSARKSKEASPVKTQKIVAEKPSAEVRYLLF